MNFLLEKNKLPPFVRLIAIIITSKDRNLSLQGAKEIKIKFNKIKDIEILGPIESPFFENQKKFSFKITH